MTPLILLALLAFALLTFAVLTIVAVRQARRRLPAPTRLSRSSDELLAQVRVSHECSVERTAALNRDLELLRTGRGTRHDR